jgi:DNA-binding GntR family transcriptional regulator
MADLERALAALEDAIERRDMAAAKSAHDSFHGLLLAGARNPLLVAMFNQAQVARLSNVSPEHKSFYDPRHLEQHRALLRALRKRDARAASSVVRKHFQSLGLMLEVVTRTSRKRHGKRPHAPEEIASGILQPAQVLQLVSRPRRAVR